MATFGRGRRPGRPPKVGARLRHGARPALAAAHPVHVTWRFRVGLPNLRTPELMRVIRGRFVAGKRYPRDAGGAGAGAGAGFRLVHFSVQRNHVHLLCEASDAMALARGLQGLAIRVAKGLNKHLSMHGRVFDDRYHHRILKSPKEVRWALGYVLNNTRKHNAELLVPKHLPRDWIDRGGSSAPYFPAWRTSRDEPVAARPLTPTCPVAAPATWLLRSGWQRAGPAGPLSTDLVPG